MCVFNKEKNKEWKCILLKGKKSGVLELVVSLQIEKFMEVCEKGHCESFVHGQDWLRLNLIKKKF